MEIIEKTFNIFNDLFDVLFATKMPYFFDLSIGQVLIGFLFLDLMIRLFRSIIEGRDIGDE